MTPSRILIVEDEAVVALDLRTRLGRLGHFVVDAVASADAAIQSAQQQRPDLILMDIRLRGERDGIEAAQFIRTEMHLPVVYLTAHADEATIDRARVTEPFGYILKPFDEQELRTVIEMAIYKHQAECKLRQSERRYATTLASIGDGVISTDTAGRVTFMNPVSEKLTGWSLAESTGMALTEIFNICNEDTRLQVENPVERVLSEGVVVGLANHTILISRDGNEAPIDDCAAPIHDDAGRMTGAVLVFRDVSQARLIESHMRHAQKLEAVGQLAGGIAHDFNNMLTVILNYSEMLLHSAGAEHPWSGFLREIHRAGERSADLTRHLLTFCRRQLIEPQIIDLNEAVLHTQQMLRRLIGENIELCVRLEPDLGNVRMDRGQIERILVNLAVNARDAMPDQGQLTIETCNVDVAAGQIPSLVSGKFRCIRISDNGHGIPVAYRDRIFEPFFTTKEPGKGTGLGLAAVYGAIQQCGGWIGLDSEIGRGTTFTIYLPAATEPVSTGQSTNGSELPRGTETILLVEDEVAVRSLSRHALSACGYTILEAENGAEAIQVAADHSGRIDIVVTDVVMPKMGARKMLELLRPHLRDMKVLLVSGYGDEKLFPEVSEYLPTRFLQKPYTIAELASAVRSVLDGDVQRPGNGG